MEETIRTIAVYALPVLFAITLHEAAHAYAAKYFGDNTAYSQGRMSLNPLVHIDIWGTIVIPVLMFLFTPFVFGYAKPVPVEFGRLRNPKRDMAWVSLAGPFANFVMAVLWLILGVLLVFFQVGEEFPHKMAQAGIVVNLLIMAFNLLPIPPLDGGRVVTAMLPHRAAYAFARIEPYGFFIVLALVMLRVVGYWLTPVMALGGYLVQLAATPFTFFLL
ncbi:MAG: site-2 protease family protein [Massilia sp.]|jgi:Zn-dependent protease|uniref:site-2 protease family protein n=1 Tax=Massilia sp. TaxID=1882437 RepID=UPI00198380F9|nr:site-2 protease family protein [Oxalobacteraceae sp. CFBP 8761]MBD8626227.1 site-2 protease family protein [Oxalobacteraceae sp. CFBP 8753]MBD8630667.1 site-2 protease family protein [Oxalobacteraceae sp. CFBP 8755]MBD8724001.1 site-2 protease family protein [Oxalobacteraceae sp. CFBP 13708]